MNIQWFPGHMAKTRRLITENLKLVDIVIELLDARIPFSSQNPILPEIIGAKPLVKALNKADLADEAVTAGWIASFRNQGRPAIAINSNSGEGFGRLKDAVNNALTEKFKKEAEKGMKKRPPKMMVVGIPNVGKSSFINKLSGRAGTNTGDRPGVTTHKQWIRIPGGFELLDTPGILWPKFEDQQIGLRLAFTGAVKDDVYDVTEAACLLCEWLGREYPDRLAERYKLEEVQETNGYDLLCQIGRKRGCVISGGEIDETRAAHIVLDEFRSLKLGRISLEQAGI